MILKTRPLQKYKNCWSRKNWNKDTKNSKVHFSCQVYHTYPLWQGNFYFRYTIFKWPAWKGLCSLKEQPRFVENDWHDWRFEDPLRFSKNSTGIVTRESNDFESIKNKSAEEVTTDDKILAETKLDTMTDKLATFGATTLKILDATGITEEAELLKQDENERSVQLALPCQSPIDMKELNSSNFASIVWSNIMVSKHVHPRSSVNYVTENTLRHRKPTETVLAHFTENDHEQLQFSGHQQAKTSCATLFPAAIVSILDSENNPFQCRALLDSGSQLSFITESLATEFNLDRDSV